VSSIRPLRFARWGLLLNIFLLGACGDSTDIKGFHNEIKIGILHSQTGTMAHSESSAIAGEILAVEDINSTGGITIDNKRYRLNPIIRDGESDPEIFALHAQKLVGEEQLEVVFGGWTSSSRKAMLPTFENHDALLFYPIQYEGSESATNVFYFGATPSQQSIPALEWFRKQGWQDFFLIGSDYVYPRVANDLFKQWIKNSHDSALRGEIYIPLNGRVDSTVINQIKKSMPRGGVIVNTINGDSNESFFRQLQSHFLTEINGYQILSFSVDEALIHQFGSRYLSGSYISQGFLQDLDSKNAKRFVKRFHRRFGSKQPVPEPASTGYSMVQLWAHAVETVGTTNATLVAEALIGMRFESPAGTLEISPNRHVSRTIRLGQILPNGQVMVIEDFGRIEPSDNN